MSTVNGLNGAPRWFNVKQVVTPLPLKTVGESVVANRSVITVALDTAQEIPRWISLPVFVKKNPSITVVLKNANYRVVHKLSITVVFITVKYSSPQERQLL